MDPYVVFPHWHGLITAYFFLGGIAAGAYAISMLAGLFGDEEDHRVVRVADYLAFPLVCACGALLVVDLNRPERFWHMLVQSETFRPMFKWWSPISAGSWALAVFGAFSFVSFVAVIAEDRLLGLGRFSELARRLRTGWVGHLFEIGGSLAAFFVAAYTGTLLSASNQPVWAQSTWISPLFLASSASTGVAAILLMGGRGPGAPSGSVERLEWLDSFAIVLELAMLCAFAWSLGPIAGRAFALWPGILIPAFVAPVGLALPLVARRIRRPWTRPVSALAVLGGGLVLRYAIVGMPVPLVVGR
jgi:formate-dependent nitrite reductase membrane component NrfD